MAFTSQAKFDNSNTITITLASLADGSIATSSTIDNSSDKFIAASIQLKLRTGTGTDLVGGVVLYLVRSVDGGTTFDSPATEGSEVLASYNVNEDSTDYRFSAETTRVGLLPSHWKIAVKNDSGGPFDSTASNFSAEYSGKKFEIV